MGWRTYSERAGLAWRIHKRLTKLMWTAVVGGIVAALLHRVGVVIFCFAVTALLFNLRKPVARVFARSFDHALTAKLTRDMDVGDITQRERDKMASLKRSITGGG